MQLAIIAALSRNRVIGYQGQMPWHLPNDLRRFKRLTTGGTIIMGRKTYQSIGRALPNRRNIVLSRDANFQADTDAVEVFSDLQQALQDVQSDQPVFVIGGAQIYQQALPLADEMYLTLIDAEFKGDTFFPEWSDQTWQVIASEAHTADDRHAYAYRFVDYRRLL